MQIKPFLKQRFKIIFLEYLKEQINSEYLEDLKDFDPDILEDILNKVDMMIKNEKLGQVEEVNFDEKELNLIDHLVREILFQM